MELSSAEAIAHIMASGVLGERVKPARKQRPRSTGGRCQCGRCRQCREEARWNRIFLEKFADPDYYTGSPVRCSSPLA